MKAAVWHGRRDVRVDEVDDPKIQEPTDAVIEVTTTGVYGSDLHLYDVLAPFRTEGDILGHEPMGTVREVGGAAGDLQVGDRVVVPFNISCGHCFMRERGLQSQCETTQVRNQGCGAALFGYTKLYGQVPGGQAQYLRVPQAPVRADQGARGPPGRPLRLPVRRGADSVAGGQYAIPAGGSVVVLGLGPIGDMSARIARHRGAATIIGVDLVPERLDRARRRGIDVIDISGDVDIAGAVVDATAGRGGDAVIDAVGMEAHGSPAAKAAQAMLRLVPGRVAEMLMTKAGVDRLAALHTSFELVRRGGTVSIVGVYGGMTDPMPMMMLFDKHITIRMGQANVRHWVSDILPLLTGESDPLDVDDFATHRVPLSDVPDAYATFQAKQDGAVKVLFKP
jgi:threonine dehydrogenase-like Zn-dependent dehydrogenase